MSIQKIKEWMPDIQLVQFRTAILAVQVDCRKNRSSGIYPPQIGGCPIFDAVVQ